MGVRTEDAYPVQIVRTVRREMVIVVAGKGKPRTAMVTAAPGACIGGHCNPCTP